MVHLISRDVEWECRWGAVIWCLHLTPTEIIEEVPTAVAPELSSVVTVYS